MYTNTHMYTHTSTYMTFRVKHMSCAVYSLLDCTLQRRMGGYHWPSKWLPLPLLHPSLMVCMYVCPCTVCVCYMYVHEYDSLHIAQVRLYRLTATCTIEVLSLSPPSFSVSVDSRVRPNNNLIVEMKGAVNLFPVPSSPIYCEVRVGGVAYCTHSVKGAANPQWHCSVSILSTHQAWCNGDVMGEWSMMLWGTSYRTSGNVLFQGWIITVWHRTKYDQNHPVLIHSYHGRKKCRQLLIAY